MHCGLHAALRLVYIEAEFHTVIHDHGAIPDCLYLQWGAKQIIVYVQRYSYSAAA